VAAATVAAGCSTGANPPAGASSGTGQVIRVVAAENFWGSIASQVGGTHVSVTSIITNPNTDPHSYEATPADGRAIATAQLVIENGIGYDPWVQRLINSQGGDRALLNVGQIVGVADGGNPHRWYNPADVQKVIAAFVAELSTLDPGYGGYFQAQASRFNTVDLGTYNSLIAQIKSRYAATPVGASESIFSMLAPALGLDLITPYSFLRAISEGSEVSAADKSTIDNQIKNHLIKIYVYNSQNTTPDVQAQLSECRAQGIPTTTITETLAPATATYQGWQADQLQGILAALKQATGR
jgi:zinc/manganese transport system substrate-binding protein